jgi:hypothetical protein
MNYARIRNKLKEKQKELSKMSGADRTKLEQHLISEAGKEEGQQSLAPVEAEKVEAPKAQAQGNKNANRRN